jgi:DNA-binding GntR family transcriptional regulator
MAKTLTEVVYDKLRDDIINLRLKPGEKLSEERLARRYEVSRAPIRDAVQKLLQEDLVLVKPQVGTIIMPISLMRIKDVVEVRMLLEPYAAGVAAERLEDEDLKALAYNFSTLESGNLSVSHASVILFETDNMLHQTIWRLCGNNEIFNVLYNYRGLVQRTVLAKVSPDKRVAPRRDEIFAIFKGLQNRNCDAARKAMQVHVGGILSLIEKLIHEENSRFQESVGLPSKSFYF